MSEKKAATTVDPPEVLARIEAHLDQVDHIARQLRREYGRRTPLDDLIGYGREGLLVAARSFDSTHKVPFKHWAYLKIRGSMIDGVRRTGHLGRTTYKKLRALEAANRAMEAAAEDRAAGPPVESLTPEEADALLGDQLATAAMAMALGFLTKTSVGLEEVLAEEPSPESSLGTAVLLEHVKTAIAERPEPERHILTRHYFDDLTLEDAGKEIGLSKSWSSRVHARALEAIARSMKHAAIK